MIVQPDIVWQAGLKGRRPTFYNLQLCNHNLFSKKMLFYDSTVLPCRERPQVPTPMLVLLFIGHRIRTIWIFFQEILRDYLVTAQQPIVGRVTSALRYKVRVDRVTTTSFLTASIINAEKIQIPSQWSKKILYWISKKKQSRLVAGHQWFDVATAVLFN